MRLASSKTEQRRIYILLWLWHTISRTNMYRQTRITVKTYQVRDYSRQSRYEIPETVSNYVIIYANGNHVATWSCDTALAAQVWLNIFAMSNHHDIPPNVEEYSAIPPVDVDPSQVLLDTTQHVQFATYPPDDKIPPWQEKDNRKGFGCLVFHLHLLILSLLSR